MSKKSHKIKHLMLGMLATLSFFLFLCSTDAAIEYMNKGLSLCASSVIPSLFPFMVISEIIVSSGIGIKISKLFVKPMRYIFGISEAGTAAYILGAVCGFPIGAKTAVSMYDKGMMTKEELERLLTFCNNPGSAFVISAIGASLLGNKKLGILLYICIILSSLLIGSIGKYLMGYKRNRIVSSPLIIPCELGIRIVTSAVSSSALSMLTICAYVTFFSALIGCVGSFLSSLSLPRALIACVFGFFELSSGVGSAAELSNQTQAILLCALFSGWSGLSVHFQIMSVCSGRDISYKPYIFAKAAQGVICAALMMLLIRIPSVNTDIGISSPNTPAVADKLSLISLTILAMFLSSVISVVAEQIKFFVKKSQKNKKRY